MPEILIETEIAASPERCFDLSRSIDLHVATQKGHAETAVAGRTSGLIELGESVTWSARHFLVRWRMTSRIVAFDRPRSFRDAADPWPFARFEHDHFYRASGSRTLMVDRVVFASPFGWLGRIVDRLVMKRHLTKLLAERAEAIKQCAETGLGDRFVPQPAAPPRGRTR
jgi:ligand-binding SRPBCC domain-containing protein